MSDASRSAADTPLGPVHARAQRDLIAANRAKILAALMDVAGPNAPPSEDEILGLILGEMSFMQMQKNGPAPPPERDPASGR